MFKIEVLVGASELDEIKDALQRLDVSEYTISEVFCHEDAARMRKTVYRGAEYCLGARRFKVELLVPSTRLEETTETLTQACNDAAIVAFEVADAINIRAGNPLLCAVR